MEISAKTGQNVDNTFQITVTGIYKNIKGNNELEQEPVNRKAAGSVRIDNRSYSKPTAAKKKNCGC